MKPIYRLILVFAVYGSIAPLASGQAVLDKTTLGSSQNDYRDFENSLIPGKKRYGKGEKKEEVDLKTLQSKSIKDPTFQGNLMDIDLDWGGEKLGKTASGGDKDPKGAKTADNGGEKDAKVSKHAETVGDKDAKASKSTQSGDDQNKDQKAKPATSEQKPSEKEKAAPTKPDGDR